MLKKHTQVSLIKTTPENIVFSDGDVVTAKAASYSLMDMSL